MIVTMMWLDLFCASLGMCDYYYYSDHRTLHYMYVFLSTKFVINHLLSHSAIRNTQWKHMILL